MELGFLNASSHLILLKEIKKMRQSSIHSTLWGQDLDPSLKNYIPCLEVVKYML